MRIICWQTGLRFGREIKKADIPRPQCKPAHINRPITAITVTWPRDD